MLGLKPQPPSEPSFFRSLFSPLILQVLMYGLKPVPFNSQLILTRLDARLYAGV